MKSIESWFGCRKSSPITRFAAVLMSALLVTAVSACSSDGDSSGTTDPDPSVITVKFETDGGTTIEDQSIKSGKTAEKPENPEKNGYEFAGWYLGDDEFNFETALTEATSLTAHWNIISYSITWAGIEDAQNPNESITEYTVENEIILQGAEKEGFIFEGWFDAETDGNKVETIQKGTTGTITLYAHWKKGTKAQFGNISVVLGTLNGDADVELNYDQSYMTFTASDKFASYSWRLDGTAAEEGISGSKFEPDFSKLSTGSHSVTVIVTDADGVRYSAETTFFVGEAQYFVYLLCENGEFIDGTSFKILTRVKDMPFTLPTAEQMFREDYKFAGWYKAEFSDDEGLITMGDAVTEIPSGTTEDLAFLAAWELDIPVVTITPQEIDSISDFIYEVQSNSVKKAIIKITGITDEKDAPEDWTQASRDEYRSEAFESIYDEIFSTVGKLLTRGSYTVGKISTGGSYTQTQIILDLSESSITYVPFQAFYGTPRLEEVILPKTVTAILDYAFNDTAIKSITIPASVTFIGDGAFGWDDDLNAIEFEGTKEQWNAVTLGDDWNLEIHASEVKCSDGFVELEECNAKG